MLQEAQEVIPLQLMEDIVLEALGEVLCTQAYQVQVMARTMEWMLMDLLSLKMVTLKEHIL